MNRGTELLRGEGLSKDYSDGQVTALADVSVSLAHGEYIAIMGPSGSGKSTLLHLLGGLDRPDRGEVYFEGRPLSALPNLDAFRARQIGFVFQSFHLLASFTAVENVQVPMFGTGLSAAQRVRKAHQLLEAVGMSHRADHLRTQLSVGERQRVAIARALANDPVVLLADEPTGNLDSASAESILALFAQIHQERGTTLVIVTHSPEVAGRAGRLLRLRDGRVVSDEPVSRPATLQASLSASPGGTNARPTE